MTPLNRLPAAIAFLALLALPVATQGKPSSKVPPSTKNTPPVESGAMVKKTPKLATKHIAKVKKIKPMTIEAKQEVLAASGIQADAGDLGEPVTVSVRDPSEKHATLSFTGLNMVLANQGVAVIGQLSDMNEFDAPAHEETTEASTTDLCDSLVFMALCAATSGPAAAAAAGGTVPQVGGGYVTLRFRAAPDTGYVVDCLASGDTSLDALVIVDKAVVDHESGPADGRFELYVPRGARRDVRVDLAGGQPWTLRQCQLTPVRS